MKERFSVKTVENFEAQNGLNSYYNILPYMELQFYLNKGFKMKIQHNKGNNTREIMIKFLNLDALLLAPSPMEI